jgi:hypothetical protein
MRLGFRTVARHVDASLVDGYCVLKESGYCCLYRNDREGEVDESREEKDQGASLYIRGKTPDLALMNLGT